MTIRTRRRLILCAIVAALTLPAELILVKAVAVDEQTASSQWVRSLTAANLAAAAEDQTYTDFRLTWGSSASGMEEAAADRRDTCRRAG